MDRRTRAVAPLLFGSGMCALVYQVAWTRELRLVFGASTAASAAVLAIFIGGLGIGGLLIGRRADRSRRPLALYAHLEMGVALSAAVTPGLLWLARRAYIAVGGAVALGAIGGTLAQLLLSTLVLAVPTVLMGGTLPAAARAVADEDDTARRRVALLYGVNTLGAVTGSLLSTFLLLEVVGTRRTLWMACLVNLLVALVARSRARELPEVVVSETKDALAPTGSATPAWFALGAAGAVGFAFFLLELVWYRMLGPLLGGTVYSFGLILAVALFGIGVGGALYARFGRDRPATISGFALTCLLEAAAVALPFALGDRIAVWTIFLRPLGGLGFAGHLVGWTLITALVVLPAAIVAGWQFPLLIALLGRGRHQVGRQIGLAYLANTIGAIAGSLAGGFGLLPLLTAPGCWRLVAALLLGLGLAAFALALLRDRLFHQLVAPLATALLAALLLLAPGPTAVWRHSQIGVGRVPFSSLDSVNGRRDWMATMRRQLVWERDGVESSVALVRKRGDAFVVNGKVDGNARGDAGTQVMSGLLGGLLHGAPRRGCVIGLGTGSTAGWMAAIPGIEAVDVVELEPAVVEVARACARVNRDVLSNPKVRLFLGDAREVLLTGRSRYDLVASEPSNPYRAGISSLYTREFYEAVAGQLADDGLFLQWVQAYDIDARALRSVYATLGSVFPSLETWVLADGDLMLIGSRRPRTYDAAELRRRIAVEPFRSGLANAWRVADLEGVLAHFVATPTLAASLLALAGENLNTDDLSPVEFGFARSVTGGPLTGQGEVMAAAHRLAAHRPPITGLVDWTLVDAQLPVIAVASGAQPPTLAFALPGGKTIAAALGQHLDGRLRAALDTFRGLGREPRSLAEIALVADGLADAGDDESRRWIEQLRPLAAIEADFALSRVRLRQARFDEAVAVLERALVAYRDDPWPLPSSATHALEAAIELGAHDRSFARRLSVAVAAPFAVGAVNEARLEARFELALRVDDGAAVAALAEQEPHVPWRGPLLSRRRDLYDRVGHPLAARAARELAEFVEEEPLPFASGLLKTGSSVNVQPSPIDEGAAPPATR